MKKIFTLLTATLLTASVFAQAPEKMSYQAVIRDDGGQLVVNQEVGLKISILQGSIDGDEIYSETQTPTTNENGLLSIEIGGGVGFSEIDWSDAPYFFKTETDPTGGIDYTITGTSQLLSVPFALHSKTAETVIGDVEYAETDPTVPQHVKDIEIDDIDNWNEAYAWGDHSEAGYLTDYIVTEEDVTSHQEALEITEGQITDLQDYYLATNPNGFISDYIVTQGDVTSHQEALEITEGQITDLGNYIEIETGKGLQAEGTQIGQMQYWNGSEWITVAPGSAGQVLTFVNGAPNWSYDPTSIPIPEATNPTTGATWMDRNLGATQVATSSTDSDSYGDLYQWGRLADGHQIRTSGTTSTLSDSDTPGHSSFIRAPNSPYNWRSPQNNNLWQGITGINNPCPAGYRLPTEAEWNDERLSWSEDNASGAFASPLKLPVAGFRDHFGSFGHVASFGHYWSSTIDGNNSRRLYFGSDFTMVSSNFRAFGHSVRCIKE